MHDLARQAYEELYQKGSDLDFRIAYGKLHGYNASIQRRGNVVTFGLSSKFESCEPEIQKGVMQFLLNKLNRTKNKSADIDLYHSFVKRMSDYAPVTKTDPILQEAFERMNERYFNGLMPRPNLVWGRRSTSLLGTYTYATDTIMISAVLQSAPEELLDSVMHHEMLHKKHKFSCSGGRTHSHTAAFRRDEALFYDKDAERKMQEYLRGARRPRESSFLNRVMGWG